MPRTLHPPRKGISNTFRSCILCKTRDTHRGPLQPLLGLELLENGILGANINVKPSTSRMEHVSELCQSHKSPKQVVRMLVLSMKNNLWCLVTFSRAADPFGSVGWTCRLFDFAFFENDANQRKTVNIEKWTMGRSFSRVINDPNK